MPATKEKHDNSLTNRKHQNETNFKQQNKQQHQIMTTIMFHVHCIKNM